MTSETAASSVSAGDCDLVGQSPTGSESARQPSIWRELGDGNLVRVVGRDLRRATLAVLLRAREPLSLDEIVRRLRDVEGIDTAWIGTRARIVGPIAAHRTAPTVGKVIADLLRHQVAYGRVRRVRRGVYQIDRSGLSSSTAHRCLNWQRIIAGEIRGR